jgi:hypothetical protein
MTEACQRYLPAVRDALDALGDATNGLTRMDVSSVLVVSTFHRSLQPGSHLGSQSL